MAPSHALASVRAQRSVDRGRAAGLLSRETPTWVQGADAFLIGGRPRCGDVIVESPADPARSKNPGTHDELRLWLQRCGVAARRTGSPGNACSTSTLDGYPNLGSCIPGPTDALTPAPRGGAQCVDAHAGICVGGRRQRRSLPRSLSSDVPEAPRSGGRGRTLVDPHRDAATDPWSAHKPRPDRSRPSCRRRRVCAIAFAGKESCDATTPNDHSVAKPIARSVTSRAWKTFVRAGALGERSKHSRYSLQSPLTRRL